jgi:hypothetical protein
MLPDSVSGSGRVGGRASWTTDAFGAGGAGRVRDAAEGAAGSARVPRVFKNRFKNDFQSNQIIHPAKR